MNKQLIQAPLCKLLFASNLFKVNLCTNVLKTTESRYAGTVDQDEIKKHTQLAEVWWNPDGSMKALHAFNHLRVPFVRDGIADKSFSKHFLPLENKTILDVGCGGGILSEPLARLGGIVTGIDASWELIDLAKTHSSKLIKKPTYICTTIEEHSSEYSQHYDCVVASEIIEHVNDKELFVKSCVDTLKPDGRIFFTTPNRSRLTQIFGIYFAEYVFNIVPKGTHDYKKFTTPNELTFMLERNNCHVEAVYGLMYYPILNRWNWVKSPIFAFALQAVKL